MPVPAMMSWATGPPPIFANLSTVPNVLVKTRSATSDDTPIKESTPSNVVDDSALTTTRSRKSARRRFRVRIFGEKVVSFSVSASTGV